MVDFTIRRFAEELNRLKPYAPPRAAYSASVRSLRPPAWRPLFGSLLAYGHSTGYRLPSYEHFWGYLAKAWSEVHPKAELYRPFFEPEGEHRPAMRVRVADWYAMGMSEAWLYVCLTEVLEDVLKLGVVWYDWRVDIKHKADVFVLVNGIPALISGYNGRRADRPATEARREANEHETKARASYSAHWGNQAHTQVARLEINMTVADSMVVNGVRLFSLARINELLSELYVLGQVEGERQFFIPEADIMQAAQANPGVTLPPSTLRRTSGPLEEAA